MWDMGRQKWVKQSQSPTGPGGGAGVGGGPALVPLSTGGFVSGPGTSTSDSIPAMLSDGEYVIRSSSASKLGLDLLNFVNKNGEIPGFFTGGPIIADRPSAKKPAAKKPAAKPSANIRSAIAKPSANIRSAIAADKKSTPQTAKQKRDALYKAGGFQGFEAGFQGMMADIAKNPVVKAIGNAYSADNLGGKAFRAVTAVLSTPVEIMGAVAKNAIDMYGMGAKGDIAGMLKAGVTGLSGSVVKGTLNAFSGVKKAENQKSSMFEQAAQSAIDNNILGAKTNPEMAALARIIGGTLNIAGDPLTYLGGAGLVTGTAKAVTGTAKAVTGAARSTVQAAKLAKSAGMTPKVGFNVLERTEQAIVARNTERTFDQARDFMRAQTQIDSAAELIDFYKPFNVAKNTLSNMDRYSVGPKIPLMYPGMQKSLGQLAPEQIQDLATQIMKEIPGQARPGQAVRGLKRTPGSSVNPYNVFTGNTRTRIKDPSRIKDFLYTRGIIPKPKTVKELQSQIESGLSNRLVSELGIMPQVGPFPKVVGAKNMKHSLGAFVSGSQGATKAKTSRFSESILGPLSTYMDRGSTIGRAKENIFLHENVHIFDMFSQAFAPRSQLPDTLKMDGVPEDARNAVFEARARSRDAIIHGDIVGTYAPSHLMDPEQLIFGAATGPNPEMLKHIISSYLAPNAPRRHQFSSVWIDNYLKTVKAESERLGIRVHSDQQIAALERASKFFKDNNIDALENGLVQNMTNLISGVKNYKSAQFGQDVTDRAVLELRKLALKNGIPTMQSPKYFNAGGLAKGTDIIPSMLTPGEFVMSKYAVQNYGVDKLRAINSGKTSSDSVYNYEVNINVKSDSNPDQIARAVIGQIKQIDSQRIRGNKF
jgi:hypothetical protein